MAAVSVKRSIGLGRVRGPAATQASTERFDCIWYIGLKFSGITEIVILFHYLGNRGYYRAAQGYEFYLRVLKVSRLSEANE